MKERKTVVCFGDSNTFGHNPKDGTRLPWGVRWTSLVQEALKEEVYVVEEGLCSRTTVWDDPVEGVMSGISYLEPCLSTHRPVHILVLMLGTNDLKPRFGLSAYDIARGNVRLIQTARQSLLRKQGFEPQILLISPIAVGEGIAESSFGEMFGNERAREISLEFPRTFEAAAKECCCRFLDAAAVARPSREDQIHMDPKGHRALGEAVIKELREML
ncbi:MAG TPA: acylhydrolase [Candidatus Limivivens intestinipullorum]|uniref:Acylhydrolase n=1 Tax=Candidatus Limivivens intestinipullorum TaxID=2840858 RepID=A0A9D1EUV9_9FIRM|nr:acylhydrolase [Candidatus Limivivens intestinipullorum]